MNKTISNSYKKLKKPLKYVKKIKYARWLLPGWVFYEYYKLNKEKGETKSKSITSGAKAEVIRLIAFASVPLPGSYELTTTGLALLKRKIQQGKIEDLNLRAFKDFTPLRKIKIDKNKIIGSPYLKIYSKKKKLFFDVIYKNYLKEKLFVYGTLINPKVQKLIIGRETKGIKDELFGYEKIKIFINGKNYPITKINPKSKIEGIVISINKKELKLIDKYEGNNYKRKKIILSSGIKAWIYIKNK